MKVVEYKNIDETVYVHEKIGLVSYLLFFYQEIFKIDLIIG